MVEALLWRQLRIPATQLFCQLTSAVRKILIYDDMPQVLRPHLDRTSSGCICLPGGSYRSHTLFTFSEQLRHNWPIDIGGAVNSAEIQRKYSVKLTRKNPLQAKSSSLAAIGIALTAKERLCRLCWHPVAEDNKMSLF